MGSIEIPDAVITWHAEENHDFKDDYTTTFRVEARVTLLGPERCDLCGLSWGSPLHGGPRR